MRKEVFADVQALRENPTFVETLEIVVKFKDDGKVKHMVDAFWSDPVAATLLHVTYSRELVLAFPCKTTTKVQREKEARNIAAKLMASPDIACAEPNPSFPTQGQRRAAPESQEWTGVQRIGEPR